MPAVVLSPDDVKILQNVLDKTRSLVGNPRNRSRFDSEELTAPEVYLALTPEEGIPATAVVAGGGQRVVLTGFLDHPFTLRGFGGTSEVVGTSENLISGVDCTIYRVLRDVVTLVGFERRVYNISDVDIPGNTLVLIIRDKYGTWYAVVPGEGGEATEIDAAQVLPSGFSFAESGLVSNVSKFQFSFWGIRGPSNVTGSGGKFENIGDGVVRYTNPTAAYYMGLGGITPGPATFTDVTIGEDIDAPTTVYGVNTTGGDIVIDGIVPTQSSDTYNVIRLVVIRNTGFFNITFKTPAGGGTSVNPIITFSGVDVILPPAGVALFLDMPIFSLGSPAVFRSVVLIAMAKP